MTPQEKAVHDEVIKLLKYAHNNLAKASLFAQALHDANSTIMSQNDVDKVFGCVVSVEHLLNYLNVERD